MIFLTAIHAFDVLFIQLHCHMYLYSPMNSRVKGLSNLYVHLAALL